MAYSGQCVSETAQKGGQQSVAAPFKDEVLKAESPFPHNPNRTPSHECNHRATSCHQRLDTALNPAIQDPWSRHVYKFESTQHVQSREVNDGQHRKRQHYIHIHRGTTVRVWVFTGSCRAGVQRNSSWLFNVICFLLHTHPRGLLIPIGTIVAPKPQMT